MNGRDNQREEQDGDDAARVVRRAGTSFYWAMRLLPEPKRSAMYAIYAFCREADDIADGHAQLNDKRAGLTKYRDAVGDLYAGRDVALPSVRGLVPFVDRYHLAESDFLAVLDGMETDAHDRVRLADQAALDLYVDHVACAVGRLSCPVFGVAEDMRHPLAKSLGTALQYTNILRDLREDAERDRVYLPEDQIKAAGFDPSDAQSLVEQPDLRPICQPVADAASIAFSEADTLLGAVDPTAGRPARMMREAYGRLFAKVCTAGFAPLPRQRVRLGKREKLAVMLRHRFFGG